LLWRIETHFDDLMRVVLSIQAGKISSTVLLRRLSTDCVIFQFEPRRRIELRRRRPCVRLTPPSLRVRRDFCGAVDLRLVLGRA
jgi:hypothetical protein